MSLAFTEHDVAVWQGDAREQLTLMPAGSVQCAVTSPPYFGLRDYGVAGQLGLESSPAEYVARMVAVFAELRRVLAADGVLWLNLGDSYAGNGSPGGVSATLQGGTSHRAAQQNLPSKARPSSRRDKAPVAAARDAVTGLPAKNMLGMPWRTAFALQDDGWILRNAVVWAKPNAMPESVTDRLSTRYELVFLFSKSRQYWFELDPIREPHISADDPRWLRATQPGNPHRNDGGMAMWRDGKEPNTLGRNPGDVWSIPTSPFPGAHFACMPPALAERCIKAGCPPGGTVLDPFAGSGTTLAAARKLGRKSVGIELNPDYIDLIRDRIGQAPLEFDNAAAAPIIGLEPCGVQDGFDFGEAAL